MLFIYIRAPNSFSEFRPATNSVWSGTSHRLDFEKPGSGLSIRESLSWKSGQNLSVCCSSLSQRALPSSLRTECLSHSLLISETKATPYFLRLLIAPVLPTHSHPPAWASWSQQLFLSCILYTSFQPAAQVSFYYAHLFCSKTKQKAPPHDPPCWCFVYGAPGSLLFLITKPPETGIFDIVSTSPLPSLPLCNMLPSVFFLPSAPSLLQLPFRKLFSVHRCLADKTSVFFSRGITKSVFLGKLHQLASSICCK